MNVIHYICFTVGNYDLLLIDNIQHGCTSLRYLAEYSGDWHPKSWKPLQNIWNNMGSNCVPLSTMIGSEFQFPPNSTKYQAKELTRNLFLIPWNLNSQKKVTWKERKLAYFFRIFFRVFLYSFEITVAIKAKCN